MKSMKQLRAIHASKKVPSRKNPHVMLHPDLADAEKSWQYNTGGGTHSYGQDKKTAMQHRIEHIRAGNQTSKLRYGSARRTQNYGYQKRYSGGSPRPTDKMMKVDW